MRPASRLAGTIAAIAAITGAAPLHAAPNDDGVYGRFDGDLTLRAEAGVGLASGGPSLSAGAAALYLGTAGIYAHYADALGRGEPCPGGGCGPDVVRSIAAGVAIQPLFLARYGSNLEHGPAHLDLLLDSFGMELGAVWSAPRGAGLQAEPGLELALRLSFPLLGRASGPFLGLRGALRLQPDEPRGWGGLATAGLLSVTLGWSQVVSAHLVDAGDGSYR